MQGIRMSYNKPNPPRPVTGIVFARSLTKTFGLIALWAVLGYLGVCALWGPVVNKKQSEVPAEQLLVGIGLVLVGPLMITRLVRSCWVRQRLVIGPDCLQVVEQLGAVYAEDTVVLHIPYANIADFKYEDNPVRVGIDLHCLDDPETYAPKENFEWNKRSKEHHALPLIRGLANTARLPWPKQATEWHYCILVGYQQGPRAIANALGQEYSKWAENRLPGI
jgi:hypothetical protein